MERQDIQKLLMRIQADFPNFNAKDKTVMIESWLDHLKDYSFDEIALAYSSFIKGANSDFAPTPSRLIGELEKVGDMAIIPEMEAWSNYVMKAIQRSGYNSEAEYNKLPELIRQAVGSANQLYVWARDEHFDEGVASSNFFRSYRAVCQRKRTFDKMPIQLQTRVTQLIEQNTTKVNDNALLLGTKPTQVFVDEFITKDSSKYMNRLGELLNEN